MLKNILLITPNRIDIVIGIEYVDYYENQYNTDFFIDLYIEHKRAFNGLKEGKHKGKKDHINRFNNLISSIKLNKGNNVHIPVIKCNNEYWVVDGFHRSSIINYYNLKGNFTIEEKTNITQGYYPTDINYFKKRNFDVKYCNYTMECFFKYYKKDFSCVCIFPNKTKLPNVLYNKIKNKIIYELNISTINKKDIFFQNIIQILYYNEGWCKHGGYIGKSKSCFNDSGDLRFFIMEKTSLNELIKFKKEVRLFYNKGNHSIHIPDTQEECNSLLQLLNQNTLSFMNKTPSLYIKFNNFTLLFNKLKKFCKENNIDTKKICITSSSVLSVYGIRDCGDMDLFIDKKYIDIFKDTCFDNDNKYTIDKHYSKHFEDIIYNPDNHFYYQGIKFCKLSLILEYKNYRVKNNMYGEKSIEKDKRDIYNSSG